MRLTKSLLVLAFSMLVLSAGTASANTIGMPYVEYVSDVKAPDSVTFTVSAEANGYVSEFWIEYFPKVNTTDCTSAPDPTDQLLSQHGPHVTIYENLHEPNQIELVMHGLSYETDYCYRLSGLNEAGAYEYYYWSTYTTSPLPQLDNVSYDAGTGSVEYSVDLTPNTNAYFAYVAFEYFPLTDDCESGTPTSVNNWNPDGGWNGWSGFAPVTITEEVSGLTPNTVYCVRMKAESARGAVYSDWTTLTTYQPQNASIENIDFGPSPDETAQAALTFYLEDHGASDDQGYSSEYEVMIYDVGAGRCDSDNYYGGDLIYEDDGDFEGDLASLNLVNGLEYGKPYCVSIFAYSAWGASYDTVAHVEVWYGEAPQLSNIIFAKTNNQISFSGAEIHPGHLQTQYAIEYFEKQSQIACDDDTESVHAFLGHKTITEGLDDWAPAATELTNLDAATTYCVRVVASNYWGIARSDWSAETTRLDPVSAVIEDIRIAPPIGTGEFSIKATLDDSGASEDTGEANDWALRVFQVPSESCDADGTGSAEIKHSHDSSFSGVSPQAVDFSGLVPGAEYCVRISIRSAWGEEFATEEYDTTEYFSFVMPQAPVIDLGATTRTTNSVTLNGTLEASYIPTTYYAQYYLPDGDSCDGGTPIKWAEDASSAEEQIEITITGFTPDTAVCARLHAENDFGVTDKPWELIRTTEIEPPTTPTGLAASNITQTSATLSWNASTDNYAVAGYRVSSGGTQIYEGAATSAQVSLACGQTSSFTVLAFDAAGNVSDASAPFSITAAACPVQADPPAGACFAKFKKTVKTKKAGKTKAGKVVITGKPSADGKSIVFTAKASGGATSARLLSGRKSVKRLTVDQATSVKFTYKVGKKTKRGSIKVAPKAC